MKAHIIASAIIIATAWAGFLSADPRPVWYNQETGKFATITNNALNTNTIDALSFIMAKTATNYTLSTGVRWLVCEATNGTLSANLPAGVSNAFLHVISATNSTNNVVIWPNGSELINNSTRKKA